MGPKQIFRAVAVIVLAAVSTSARADAPSPVTVVELDGSNAAALRSQLVQAGFAVLTSPELDAANAGVDGGKDLGEALAALTRASAAWAAADCPATIMAADAAIAALAARGAAGIEVGDALRSAWAYVMACSERTGDLGRAMRAAAVVRDLRQAVQVAPPGFDSATWTALLAKLPEVDATAALDVVAVELVAEPGAALTVDHRPLGLSPVTAYLPAGRHVVAAAAGSRRAALWTEVSPRTRSISLRLFEQDTALSRVSERVASWRSKGIDGPEVAAYLEQLLAAGQGQPWNPPSHRSPLLVVLGSARAPLQIWASDGPGRQPTATDVTVTEPRDQGALGRAVDKALRERSAAWSDVATPRRATGSDLDRAPDLDHLLREAPAERGSAGKKPATQWWVYAAIGSALALGGGLLLANELAEDTQRVELRWP